ncbi:MAG TPA: polymer-forming cytoskeletal protein [Bryobacteraceae bacterium]|nr:polymer-forming cytoskeletal protein [Bryobacteraceae bacterium]
MSFQIKTQGDVMWNKRDEVPSAPPVQRPTPPEQAQQVAGPQPVVREAPKAPAPIANSRVTIGASMIIKGDIVSSEEIYVDGEVEGKLDLEQGLTVGPHGKVKANIKAREVVVSGDVRGNVVVSEKITIHRNASLIGDIKTAGIVIDDGAYFKGSIDIIRSNSPTKAVEAKAAKAS